MAASRSTAGPGSRDASAGAASPRLRARPIPSLPAPTASWRPASSPASSCAPLPPRSRRVSGTGSRRISGPINGSRRRSASSTAAPGRSASRGGREPGIRGGRTEPSGGSPRGMCTELDRRAGPCEARSRTPGASFPPRDHRRGSALRAPGPRPFRRPVLSEGADQVRFPAAGRRRSASRWAVTEHAAALARAGRARSW